MRQLTRAEFDALTYRLDSLQRQQDQFESQVPGMADLSGTMDSSVKSLSGTINARFLNLTGSLIAAIASAGSGDVTSAYASLQTGVTASINAAYLSLRAGSTSSISAAYSSLRAGSTASIDAAFSSLQGSSTGSEFEVLVANYPSTTLEMQEAVGYGQWDSGQVVGWHFNELTGALQPAYGSVSLSPQNHPLHALPGVRGVADRSIGIRSQGNFQTGDEFDAGTTSDVAFALVVAQTGTGGGWCIPFQKQNGTSVGPGWQVSIAPGPQNFVQFIVSGTGGAASATAAGRPNSPFVIVGGFSRATNRLSLSVRSLETGVEVTASHTRNPLDTTTVNAFRMNTNVSGSELRLAAGFIAVGSGSAYGLPENISDASRNFVRAINRVQGSLYSAITGTVDALSGTINARFATVPTLTTRQVWQAAQDVAPAALTYGASVSVNAALSNTFTLTLSGSAATLANPTNLQDGQTIVFRVLQGSTGSHALAFDSNYNFGSEGPPDLTTSAAGTLDIITCISNGSKLFCTALRGFTP